MRLRSLDWLTVVAFAALAGCGANTPGPKPDAGTDASSPNGDVADGADAAKDSATPVDKVGDAPAETSDAAAVEHGADTSPSADAGGDTGPAGTFTEFTVPTPASGPWGIVYNEGSDGAIWFTELTAGKIGRLTTEGVFTELTIPTPNSAPFGITRGADYGVWFTEEYGGKIGTIDAGRTKLTEYDVPTKNPNLEGAALGYDGKVYFAEADANKIGRISSSGAIEEFPIATPSSYPSYLTLGTDGNVWFTEAFGKIGFITTDAKITEFPVPTAGSGPVGITVGPKPDFDVWFAEGAGHAVGKSTKAGMMTEFALAPATAMPVSLARLDPYVYVTEQTGNQIIRVSTTGEMKSYPLPTPNAFPAHIVVGPDGALWFTENIANKIGRLVP